MAAEATVPRHVGVYGGGRIGAGIAHAFVVAGAAVTVVESDADAAEGARDRVIRSLRRAEARGTLSEPLSAPVDRLEVTTEPDAFAEAGLVIEAVPELAGLKRELLAKTEAIGAGRGPGDEHQLPVRERPRRGPPPPRAVPGPALLQSGPREQPGRDRRRRPDRLRRS